MNLANVEPLGQQSSEVRGGELTWELMLAVEPLLVGLWGSGLIAASERRCAPQRFRAIDRQLRRLSRQAADKLDALPAEAYGLAAERVLGSVRAIAEAA